MLRRLLGADTGWVCHSCVAKAASRRAASTLSAISKGRIQEIRQQTGSRFTRRDGTSPRRDRDSRSNDSFPDFLGKQRKSDRRIERKDSVDGDVAAYATSSSAKDRATFNSKPRSRNPSLSTGQASEIDRLMQSSRLRNRLAPDRSRRHLDRGDEVSSSRGTTLDHRELDIDGPTLPLATAASTFIYGRSAALACLRAQRRIINRAWIASDRARSAGHLADIRTLLESASIKTTLVTSASQLQSMNHTTSHRPHNGIILDVSPLPFPRVQDLLLTPTSSGTTLSWTPLPCSPEERTILSRLPPITLPTPTWRHPLVLYLDGILDEGNMGNILRSAHFFGVDAIAVCAGTCAPTTTSQVVAKAASGAIEALPLLRVDDENAFLNACRAAGWGIWASLPAPGKPAGGRAGSRGAEKGPRDIPALLTRDMRSPLADKPVLLMIGSEGEGLRPFVVGKASGRVSIAGASAGEDGTGTYRPDVGVDSMNVASATAVLLEAFLRRPADAPLRK